MKALFIIKALANKGGGAEKVLAHVVNGLADRGHHVSVITSDPIDSAPYYHFEPGVSIFRTGIGRVGERSGLRDTVRRMARYRTVVSLERPDVVIGFMHSAYIPAALALLGSGVPVIASEHTGPEHYRGRPLQKFLMQLTPLIVDQVTVVSEQVRTSFGAWLGEHMVVVPNPVIVSGAKSMPSTVRPSTVLSVGRLAAEKNHSTLIDAFARVASKHPEWVLRIVGEGQLRADLERQVESVGLCGRILLPGAVADIDGEYRRASLFVLPSIYESFGMATAEALLHGVPTIGFADCAGTNELIEDRVNGRLVSGPDRVESLSRVLDELMSDPPERERLARASTAHLSEKVGIERALSRWEELLESFDRSGANPNAMGRGSIRAGQR